MLLREAPKRAREVVRLYAGGHSAPAIAAATGLTTETVKSYIRTVRKRYKADGVFVGTKIALLLRLIEEEEVSL